MFRSIRRSIVLAVLASLPASTFAAGMSSQLGPAACSAAPSPSLASLGAPVALDLSDGITLPATASPSEDAEAEARFYAQERATFDRILQERSAVAVPAPTNLPLSPAQRSEIDGAIGRETRPKIGTAIDLGRTVEFAGVDAARPPAGGAAVAGGLAGRTGQGVLVWEAALTSDEAKALRIEFTGLSLAAGVELFVYNEDGQVWGPYTQQGPDGSGSFWSPSTFGDAVRVHVRAEDPAALAASRFTLARVMHLGARAGALQDRIRERYAVGPAPSDVDYCGAEVPDCTRNAVCWIDTNAGLVNPSNAIAHIEFVEGGSSYICTGAYLAQSGNAPQQPYFMTANHCFSTQASASSLESYFKFRTSTCNGTCPTLGTVPRVNGSTLVVTGAAPGQADFTFLRLSGFPSGGARLLGWTSAQVPEAATLVHMGHPAGSPLAFSFRRARANNSSLPHTSSWPEPTFLYSGLAATTDDWAGAIAGGSSGGPAMLLSTSGDAIFVGTLTGAAYPQEPVDWCDPNETSTIDGAFRSSYPNVRRYIYEHIFRSGFEL